MSGGWFSVAVIGVFLIVFILLMVRANRGVRKQKYDERQRLVQLEAVKLGSIVSTAAMAVVIMLLEFHGPVLFTASMWMFAIIVLDGLVITIYNIWHDAYVGYNSKANGYIALLGGIGLLNLWVGVMKVMEWQSSGQRLFSMTDGSQIGLGVFFLGIAAAFFARKLVPLQKDEEE